MHDLTSLCSIGFQLQRAESTCICICRTSSHRYGTWDTHLGNDLQAGLSGLLPLAACSNVSIIGTLHIHGVSTGDDKRVEKTWVRRPCIVPGSLRALREPSAQHILPPACRRPAMGPSARFPSWQVPKPLSPPVAAPSRVFGDVRGNPKSIEF